MRWRVSLIAAVAAVTVAGCSQTVSGTAQRAQPGAPDPDRSYGYVDDRCGLLVDETVGEILGADTVRRPYSGAVCQYVLPRGDETIDVTFSWFESGNINRERTLAVDRGAKVTEKVVERHKAFLARRDTTGAACSATSVAGSGVVSWWVQFRGRSGGDPCVEAEKLLSATLRSEM
jgi:hypothetical protein